MGEAGSSVGSGAAPPWARLCLVLYLFVLHFVAGITIWRSEKFNRLRILLTGTGKVEARPAHYELTKRLHQIQDGNVEDNSVLFFGDSLIQGMLCSRVDGKAVNFGIARDDSAGGLERMKSHPSVTRAAAVVIAFGINDLSAGREHGELLSNLAAMIDLAPPGAMVVVNSVLPVDEKKFTKVANSEIREFNRKIEAMRGSRRHTLVCDPSDELVDESGNLREEFHVGDGLHLTPAGYEVWIDRLRRLRDGDLGGAAPSNRLHTSQ